MYWFVCRKIGLFLALLHRKNVFCQFAASHADFLLDFTQNNSFVRFRLSFGLLATAFEALSFM